MIDVINVYEMTKKEKTPRFFSDESIDNLLPRFKTRLPNQFPNDEVHKILDTAE
jgi:hypothetical protein